MAKKKAKKNMTAAQKRREVERTFSGRTEAQQVAIEKKRKAAKAKKKG